MTLSGEPRGLETHGGHKYPFPRAQLGEYPRIWEVRSPCSPLLPALRVKECEPSRCRVGFSILAAHWNHLGNLKNADAWLLLLENPI